MICVGGDIQSIAFVNIITVNGNINYNINMNLYVYYGFLHGSLHSISGAYIIVGTSIGMLHVFALCVYRHLSTLP